ncbi:hypothetical protein V6N13_148598 [Hibiscus sabdariffa]|uniref:Uncharacterized protein n=1 Tax=Hibiscus sabdariffa TaxID=183260 RepID=A0ABR2TYZ7_9ROSI
MNEEPPHQTSSTTSSSSSSPNSTPPLASPPSHDDTLLDTVGHERLKVVDTVHEHQMDAHWPPFLPLDKTNVALALADGRMQHQRMEDYMPRNHCQDHVYW